VNPDAPNRDSAKPAGLLRSVPWFAWVAILIVFVMLAAGVWAVYYTSNPIFFSRYKGLQRTFGAMDATTGHKGLPCSDCHANARSIVYYKTALIGDYYLSLFRKGEQPTFVKMAKPTREACLRCHAQDWSMDSKMTSKVPHPAHLRVINEKRDCVICHKWVGHEEVYMEKHKAMPFSTVCASFPCHVGTKPAADCKNCHHQLQPTLVAWRESHPQTVRAVGPNGCLEKCHNADQCRLCHTTGKMPDFKTTLAESTVTVIEQAHVKSDWISQHGTFAMQDKSKCLTCHVSEGECQNCHSQRPAFHGPASTSSAPAPWINQHQPIAKQDSKRCLACHQQPWCDACHQQFKENR